MKKILNYRTVAGKLKEKGIVLFTPLDLLRLFPVSKVAVGFFCHRHTKKGLLIRLKKSQTGSLYALADTMPNEYLVANRLYEPSYVSLDTALSFYRMIPETIYSVTSITPKATRKFVVANLAYSYFRIKRECYTGYKPITYQNITILMAEPEKALADFIYFLTLKKRGWHYERLEVKGLKPLKLKRYIKLFKKPGMLEWMDKIYADSGKS